MRTSLILIFIALFSGAHGQTANWSVPTLKEYVDQRFNSMQEAVNKAEVATEKRFEGVNEFRNTLSDQQKTFVAKSEYDQGYATLSQQVAELKTRLDKYETLKAGGANTIAYLMAGISFFIAIIALSRNFLASVYKQNVKTIQ